MTTRACILLARRLAWPLALALSSAMTGRLTGEGSSSPPTALAPSAPPKTAERMREGSKLIEVVGEFQFSGDRVVFSPEAGGDSLRVLENLALERIGRQLTEGRGSRTWVVSGVVTEFRGGNYLLVTKAVVRLEGDRPSAP